MPGLRLNILTGAALLAIATSIPSALADTIYYQGFPYKDLTVTGYQDGAVAADLAGQQKLYPLKDIDQIDLDGQSVFNDAEAARKGKDMTKASELYTRAINGAHRGVKQAIEARAITAFDGTGKYLDGVKAFIDIYAASPTPATYELRPQKLPDASSRLLSQAAENIRAHLSDRPFATPEAQQALKSMLLEIYTQAKDAKAGPLARELGVAVPEGLQQPAAAAPVTVAPVVAPVATVDLHDADISTLQQALSARQYDAVLKQTQTMLNTVDGPTAVTLYMVQAQAYTGLSKPEEAEAAYLRAAIHFPQSTDAPNALLAAADLEKSSNPDGAKRLYTEIVSVYPTSPAALKAKQNLQ